MLFGLFVDRKEFTAKTCPDQPLGERERKKGSVTCVRDGDAWYRTSGDSYEYAVPRDGIVIRFTPGLDRVDRAVLRAAAKAVHRPDDAELDVIMPASAGSGGESVERGDLPSTGDGAPNNDVGTSG